MYGRRAAPRRAGHIRGMPLPKTHSTQARKVILRLGPDRFLAEMLVGHAGQHDNGGVWLLPEQPPEAGRPRSTDTPSACHPMESA